ncbi:MAG: HAD-IB family phosphatase [Firmicutes bacterium]|nr:HAD-IB family phosphatase [Bacillota bacterium]
MKHTIILIDFDGTITQQDSNVIVSRHYGTPPSKAMYEKVHSGKIPIRESMGGGFTGVKLSEHEYTEFIRQAVEIAPGFPEFFRQAESNNIPLAVVSGGYMNPIRIVLDREGITPAAIYANRLEFTPEGIKKQFYHQAPNCDKDYGPCGNCKASHVKHYKEQYDRVIFIGDGFTDRCGALHADEVYAKDWLADYCREHGLPFTEFNDFYDLMHILGDV